MTISVTSFLQNLAPALSGAVDECLHCTVAGNGSLARAAGITTQTYPRETHEDFLDILHAAATSPGQRNPLAQATGVHLYWMFNHVYLLSPTEAFDVPHAIRRMACRVEWGELWKKSRCDEPPLRPYQDALAFLRQRLPANPQWHASCLYPTLSDHPAP